MARFSKPIRKAKISAKRQWDVYQLGREDDPFMLSIARGIRGALKCALGPQEKQWIDRIENMRTELNRSRQEITHIDYGAGKPDANRTKSEMRTGIEVAETLGTITKVASKSPFWCLLLFKLIRALKPSSCLEMGTAVGVSAAYQAAALKLNRKGTLVTLEGDRSLADIAANNLQRLNLDNVEVVTGRFDDTLSHVLEDLKTVDFIFVDGSHDESAELEYFERTISFLARPGILVFDDINWSDGMKSAWNFISQDGRVSVAVDLGPVGLCVVGVSNVKRRYFRIRKFDFSSRKS